MLTHDSFMEVETKTVTGPTTIELRFISMNHDAAKRASDYHYDLYRKAIKKRLAGRTLINGVFGFRHVIILDRVKLGKYYENA